MKLFAISDLHIGHPANRKALDALQNHGDDWLIVAGDVGESCAHLAYTLDTLNRCFRKLIWVPGNHELWIWRDDRGLRGEAKDLALVEICRQRGVLTPEDPFVAWPGEGGEHLLAPLFLLYDYSFCPRDVTRPNAVGWAAESGVVCVDEELLLPEPFETRSAWCEARCALSEQRLEHAIRDNDCPLILINHFPLIERLVSLPLIPRFSIWCGTQRTAQWHKRFRADIVVSGHLHIRRTDWIDGVRFEEVSFGYPLRQWDKRIGLQGYLRQILPEPTVYPFAR